MAGIQFTVPSAFSGAGVSGLPQIIDTLPGPWDRRWVVDTAPGSSVASIPDFLGGSPLAGSTLPIGTDGNGHKYVTLDNSGSTKPTVNSPAITAAGDDLSLLAVLSLPSTVSASLYALEAAGLKLVVNTSRAFQISWSPYTTFGAPAADTLAVVGFTRSAAAAAGWLNLTRTTLATAATTTGTIKVNSDASNAVSWKLYELAACNEALSDTQMQSAITALKTRYGIA